MNNPPAHRPRKRFGQHFLRDDGVIQHIIDEIFPRSGEHIVEIGPGEGVLTTRLAQSDIRLDLVEIDRDLITHLAELFRDNAQVTINEADALKFDFSSLKQADKPMRLVGNLPYNISSPLLLHLAKYADDIADMHFMLQKEMVDRMASKVGGSNYGRFTVMMQYYFDIESLFDVYPDAFKPPPKVMSAVIRVVPRKTLLPLADAKVLEELVKQAFSQRRKQIRNTIGKWFTAEQLADCGVNEKDRPQQIPVEAYVNLANALFKQRAAKQSQSDAE
ncbi:MAG: 16S rRNA (adenine(1518)-N(6)/adenine(1519)-N(6))-dimethyltransferase RsmA [Pseudomonadales bacterium]|nr:16S rRNA (adenine(1518)-N(6)/adenine(1519)-N(6))-dimethyltransferase RsmA [Pseudomonadales bacterium]